LVHGVRSVVKALRPCDRGEELFDFAVNGRDQEDGFVGGGLDFESDKVKDLTNDFISVHFSVPDFNVDDQIICETFEFVKHEVFCIFIDSLFGCDRDDFELSGDIPIGEGVSLFVDFIECIETILEGRGVFFDNGFRGLFGVEPSISAVEALAKGVLFAFFKFDTVFGDADFSLYVVLFDDSGDHVGTDVLVLEGSVDFIESVGDDGAELLSAGHYEGC
jgi:hypothetical protein